MGNTFGRIFRLTTFGESHGEAVGGVIDGCPPRLALDFKAIDDFLAQRRPRNDFETPRREADKVRFLSGIKEGVTLGTPIAFIVENQKHSSAEYDELKEVFRPSHADYTYQAKYGIRDHCGGGRASARETVARVVAGAIAMQFLQQQGITVDACVTQIGHVQVPDLQSLDFRTAERSPLRCPDHAVEAKMSAIIAETQQKG
ncbi:MAG: chorismate synthase, partial [Bacteroidales bacterium]|nr:chorismate synthase [Bacteroidales bacterium]